MGEQETICFNLSKEIGRDLYSVLKQNKKKSALSNFSIIRYGLFLRAGTRPVRIFKTHPSDPNSLLYTIRFTDVPKSELKICTKSSLQRMLNGYKFGLAS